MEEIESIVMAHYSVGDLAKRILDGLADIGADLDHLTIEDLAVIDEFHIGGREATKYIISNLSLSADEHVLDIGSGIGGAGRTIVSQVGCRITGIDLTPEYVEVARILTKLTGLDDKTDFQTASALSLPFDNEVFDAAITIHMAMNILDRDALYQEACRVMKPGALFAIYDVMKKGDEPISFPVPWAETPQSSHLVAAKEMPSLLENAGFEVCKVEDRSEFAFDYFKRRLAAVSKGSSSLGPHIIMGTTAREKFQNINLNMESGRIAPVLVLARRI
jgi:ubiquinone/menaquinone biosynthesis C-methylase UbiE